MSGVTTTLRNGNWSKACGMFRALLCQLDKKFIPIPPATSTSLRLISTTSILSKKGMNTDPPKRWPLYNKQVYPPLEPGQKTRPAYICHYKSNIKYSPLKLWYCACLVRGMQIDNAIRQLEYIQRKGATYVKEALIEAQELAVQQHNVEFRSNLWVAESFATRGLILKGIRRHARKRIGIVRYRYAHYFVRLEEGSPPENYYPAKPDGPTLLQEWIKERRQLRISGTY